MKTNKQKVDWRQYVGRELYASQDKIPSADLSGDNILSYKNLFFT